MLEARVWLLAALPALVGHGRWYVEGEVLAVTEAALGPSFGHAETALVAAVGQDAELHCRVLRLGDRAVSWVRSRDLQILSHAGAVFTADARVSVRAGDDAEAGVAVTRHTLRIRQLRPSDSGRYECQLNTDPKMSLFYNLTVLDEPVPAAVVRAGAAQAAGAGGAATLQCWARYEPPPRGLPVAPLDIRWSKDGRPLSPQGARGGVSLDTERWAGRAVSRLTLAGLARADAGRYRCAVPGAAAHVQLDVRAESQMEAMQRDQSLDNGGQRAARAPPLAVAALGALLALFCA